MGKLSREITWKFRGMKKMSIIWPGLRGEKTPLFKWAGFNLRSEAALPAPSFGCFEGIDFCIWSRRRFNNMRSNVTSSGFPLQRRFRTCGAVPSGRIFSTAIASVTLLYDLVANPTIVRTPLRRHKRAFKTLSNRCTNHWNHLLSKKLKKRPGIFLPGLNRQVTEKLQEYNQVTKPCQQKI